MDDAKPIRLIGMSGSLRTGSYSNAILETLREKFSGRADLAVYDLAPIPAYNQDFEGDKRPRVIKALLADIADADGLVLCAPEFNHSIPGVLKNAIDWASRPAFASVLAYKHVAIMATSGRRALPRALAGRARFVPVADRARPRGHHQRGRKQDPGRPPDRRNLARLCLRRGRGADPGNPPVAGGRSQAALTRCAASRNMRPSRRRFAPPQDEVKFMMALRKTSS